MTKSIIDTIEKKHLIDIVNQSDSISDVIKRLGLNAFTGNTFRKVKKRIIDDDISISHFTYRRNNRHFNVNIESYLVLSDRPMKSSIKEKLISHGLLKNQCYTCGQLPFHNGKELILQIHHINGNRYDNRIHNLSILCPNCHTQTHNYAGKNQRPSNNNTKKKKKCIYCAANIGIKSKVCRICYDKNVRKLKFNPSKDELEIMVNSMPIVKVGLYYGVSDNSIRDRCIKLNINIPKFPKGHWLKKGVRSINY